MKLHKTSVVAVTCSLVLWLSNPAFAFPVGRPSCDQAYSESDLVLKGRAITSVWTDLSADQEEPAQVTISIQYVFKGNAAESEILVTIPMHPAGPQPFPVLDLAPHHGSVVLFLKQSDQGLIPTQPFFLLKVGEGAVAPPPPSEVEPGREWLWRELSEAAEDESLTARERVLCLDSLIQLSVRETETRALLAELSDSENKDIMVAALKFRIQSQDADALRRAVDLISSSALDEQEGNWLALGVSRVTSPECVELLGEALESRSEVLRREASYALRKIDSDGVVPLLAGALGDENPEVAYHAVMGLYRLEKTDDRVELPGQDYAPAIDLFLAEPDRYTSNWQQWWEAVGREKYRHVLEGKAEGPAEVVAEEEPVNYDIARFERFLEEAKVYDDSPQRVRDTAVEKYMAALAVRPDHPDNLDIQRRIVGLWTYSMSPDELPHHADARALCKQIVSENDHRPNDIRVLQVKRVLAGLYRRLDKDHARARQIYVAIMDMPDEQIVLPESWRVQEGRRLGEILVPGSFRRVQEGRRLRESEWHSLRSKNIAWLKKGASSGYIGVMLMGTPQSDPLGQMAILEELARQRPDNKAYQECVNAYQNAAASTLRRQQKSGTAERAAEKVPNR